MTEDERDYRPGEDEASELTSRVSENLEAGKVQQAKSELSRAWRDLVPELPRRFAVSLRSVDRKAAIELGRRLRRSKGRPQLRLAERDGRWWVETARGKKLVIGRLPSAEARLLADLGQLKHYRPQLLAISQDDEGRIERVSVELVRRDLRRCEQCGRSYRGSGELCGDCRRGEGERPTRQQLQEALDELAQRSAGEGGAEDFDF